MKWATLMRSYHAAIKVAARSGEGAVRWKWYGDLKNALHPNMSPEEIESGFPAVQAQGGAFVPPGEHAEVEAPGPDENDEEGVYAGQPAADTGVQAQAGGRKRRRSSQSLVVDAFKAASERLAASVETMAGAMAALAPPPPAPLPATNAALETMSQRMERMEALLERLISRGDKS